MLSVAVEQRWIVRLGVELIGARAQLADGRLDGLGEGGGALLLCVLALTDEVAELADGRLKHFGRRCLSVGDSDAVLDHELVHGLQRAGALRVVAL